MNITARKRNILVSLIYKGMNQKKLAEKIGMSNSALSNFLNGKYFISASKAKLICDELAKDFDYLFLIEEKE